MISPKSIGGFFELEVPLTGSGYHSDGLALTNGRACIRWILENEKPSRVYIPFYTCYALYEPMEKMGIEFVFYSVNEALDPVSLPEPKEGELLVIVNYYGLKNKIVYNFAKQLGKRVIIDDTHRFFHRGYKQAYSFTSARKYFGVPDGAYLYGASNVDQKIIERNTDISVLHNVKRLIGCQDEAYHDYLLYEASLNSKLKRISLLSERLLSGVDYAAVAQARINNFNFIHNRLKSYNNFSIDSTEIDVPFCYPFLPDQCLEKVHFYQQKIYIPTLWPDILERKIDGFEWEKDMTRRLLPLPVDQRYVKADMERIADFIMEKIQ
jgi:hypothetical protein